MFKNLFSRLMYTYLVVVTITVISMLTMLSYIFQDFYTREKEHRLLAGGEEIVSLVKEYEAGNLEDTALKERLRAFEHRLNADISYFEREQTVSPGTDFKSHLVEDYFTPAQIEAISRGKVVSRIVVPKGEKTRVMSVALPIVVESRVIGGISLHSPMYDVTNASIQIFRLGIIAAAISALLTVPLTLLISRRISNPLKQMSKSARKMIAGKYIPVEVSSNDEIGELASSFNYMAEELDKVERMRQDFIANVSHELRTPLAYISGVLEALADHTIRRSEADRYINLATAEAQRMSRLITELLDLVKLETDNFKMNFTRFDLKEITFQILAKMNYMFEQKELDLDLVVGEEQLIIKGDKDRVKQILLNLLHNAVTYTSAGGSIKVTLRKEEDQVLVTVTDTGIGIPEDELPYIWERFHKVDKARGRKNGGTGLGLAIVRYLVNAHGGKVGVTSKPGQWSSFWFTLPRACQGDGVIDNNISHTG